MSMRLEDVQSVQYLTFTLRNEDFAIEISKAREVLDVTTLTKIPQMPDYLNGVINLRGSVVPVMDLGQKLGMGAIERTKDSRIIIVEFEIEDSSIEMGVLTDSVQMVVDLPPENIEPVPKMGTDLNTAFIKGMGRLNDKFLIILDIDIILASEGEAALRDLNSGLITIGEDAAMEEETDTAA